MIKTSLKYLMFMTKHFSFVLEENVDFVIPNDILSNLKPRRKFNCRTVQGA